MKSRKRSPKLAPRVRKYFKAREAGSRGYKKSDEILADLLERLKPGDTIPMGDGQVARLKDNYLDKDGKQVNKIYRSHGMAKYELEIVSS